MSDEIQPPSDDWLHSSLFKCSHCGYSLWKLDHSPFYSAWFVYCDSCPRCVEVPDWDAVVLEIQQNNRDQVWSEIEQKLKPCSCGGQYKFSSAKRCFNCNGIVIERDDAFGIDIYPGHLFVGENVDLTPFQEGQYKPFEAKFGRKFDDIWL